MAKDDKRYLVTGAAGGLGRELTKALDQLGSADTRTSIRKFRDSMPVDNFDVVMQQLELIKPDIVVHLAGETSEEVAENDPETCWKDTVLGTDVVVKVCALLGIPLLHLSCHKVFDGYTKTIGKPLSETAAIRPKSRIGQAKAAAEHAIFRIGQCGCPDIWKDGFRYWVVRTGELFAEPSKAYLAGDMANQLANASQLIGRRMKLPSDRYWTPTYIPHLVKSLVWLLQHNHEVVTGVYHIANSGGCTPYDFGVRLVRAIGGSASTCVREYPTNGKSRDSEWTTLSCEKYAAISPVTMPPWEDAVREFATAFQS